MLAYFTYDGNDKLHDVDDVAPMARHLVPVVKSTGSCRVECRDDVEGDIWEQSYVPDNTPAPQTPLYLKGEIRLSDTIIHNRGFMGLPEVHNVT